MHESVTPYYKHNNEIQTDFPQQKVRSFMCMWWNQHSYLLRTLGPPTGKECSLVG